MDWLVNLLTNTHSFGHIMLVYALVVSVGMAIGQIKIFGVSLGVTFVLFVALLVNYLGVTADPTILSFMRDFGLILFVYLIGLQVGPSFVSSFKSGGVQLNLLTLLCILLSLLVTVALFFAFSHSVSLAQILGVHFGAVTNTPGLGATQEALDLIGYEGENIAVAYACAYPLGVIGLIASVILLRVFFSIDPKQEDEKLKELENSSKSVPIFYHVAITNPSIEGRTIHDVRRFIVRSFICSRILHNDEIFSPNGNSILHTGDKLRIVSEPADKDAIVAFFGSEDADLDLASEHSPIMSSTIRVTSPSVNGLRLRDLHLSSMDGVNITRIYRAGMQLFPHKAMHLQLGDAVYCVGPEQSIKRLAYRLGNQERKLEHPNIVGLFLGILLGILFGSIPLAIPGMPAPLKLGLAGGPLIIAILLGAYGPQFKLVTYTTHSANLMLREIGISLFLASIGLSAGENFVNTVLYGNGLLYVGLGLIITIIPPLLTGVIARLRYRMNYHTIAGMLAGATTNPPLLAYAGTISEMSTAAIAYSTVYPLAMFMRILSGQLILLLLWSFA